MGVAAEIGQHLLRAAEGRLGIDDPLDPAQLAKPAGEGGGLGEAGERAEEAEFAGLEGGAQFVEEQPAEEPREHAHRQEEAGPAGDPARAVERQAAAGHDAMDVRMMVQVLAPGMEHGDEADLGAEVLRDRRRSCAASRPPSGTGWRRPSALFWKAISATGAGSVKTTWKYGTGSSSACRAASHSARACPWHFGQCRLRQEL